MPQGAAIASEDFSGLASGANPDGVNLNNALGGSGTRAWSSSQYRGWDDGGGGTVEGIRNLNTTAWASVDTSTVALHVRAHFRWSPSIAIMGICLGLDYNDGALAFVNSSSLQLRDIDGDAGLSDDTDDWSPVEDTTYTLEVERTAAGVFTARVLNAAGDTELASVTHPYGTGGDFLGTVVSLRSFFSTANRDVWEDVLVSQYLAPTRPDEDTFSGWLG
ncbi:MAG: hypothetical protein WD341_01835 [Tistlia sp.]|uniref:hypothetical protein n=1 Tax=Tistlia sp. TaxID=3057121 RepID=UPI0034A32414